MSTHEKYCLSTFVRRSLGEGGSTLILTLKKNIIRYQWGNTTLTDIRDDLSPVVGEVIGHVKQNFLDGIAKGFSTEIAVMEPTFKTLLLQKSFY
jgi:hypothetical protein